MSKHTPWIVLALLALPSAVVADPPAWANNPGPAVYWQVSPTYGERSVEVTAATPDYQPDPPHEIAIASLTLPAGNWPLSGKLSEWNDGQALYGDLECALGEPGADPTRTDYSSIGLLGAEKVLSMEVPVSTSGSATTVYFACHLYGVKWDGLSYSLATANIWGAKMIALQIGPVSRQ